MSEQTPPLRLETLRAYAQDIFAPVKRGESVSTVWSPMMGRRVRNKFIISYPRLFKEEIGAKKYLLVYVEPLELTEESASGYIRLVIRSIFEAWGREYPDKQTSSYQELLDDLSRVVKEISSENMETVLFIGEFDELGFADTILYNNLKSVWAKSGGALHFIFLLLSDVTNPGVIKKFGELNEVLLKNVVYIPLLGDENIRYLLDYFSKQLDRPFSQEERVLLVKVCGGHPYLLKSCARLIWLMNGNKMSGLKLEEMLTFHFEPRSAAQKIFDLLKPEQQLVLRQIVNSKLESLSENALLLTKLGLIKKDDDAVWLPFGTMFASVINQKKNTTFVPPTNNGLTFEKTTGAIFLGGANIEEKFTRQEYEILRFFLSEPERLRTREEVGETMWGKESYDKYSDWAIDQVMSKIRKKLKSAGVENALVTVRGRGYKLSV